MAQLAKIVTFLLILLRNGRSEDLFDKVIAEFDKNGQVAAETREDCVCVPHFQCKDNITVLDNQEGLLESRIIYSPCSTVHASHSYLLVCCGQPESTKLSPIRQKRRGCGERHLHGVGFSGPSIGNDETQFGEFPWMLAIFKGDNYKCGGALVHPKVVLTAAHCVMGLRPSEIWIRAGEWDARTKLELLPYWLNRADKIITHGDYNAKMLFNDIALIIVKDPFAIREHIDMICIPEQGIVLDHTRCLLTGWDRNVFGNRNISTARLKKWDVTIVPHENCQEAFRKTRLGSHFNLHESFICATGESGNDICKDHGGSILVCPLKDEPSRYHQAGVVSWLGCSSTPNIPIAYVNIPFFREWIDDQFLKNNISSL